MADVMTYEQAKKEFVKLINSISGAYAPTQVFADFVEMAAISISNACDHSKKWEEREKKYMDLIGKYKPEQQQAFPKLLALVVQALKHRMGDFLGETYMEMNAGNSKAGQFFTPYSVSRVCAEVVFDKNVVMKTIEEKGYVGINEPSAGGGGMIIAGLEVLKEMGVNYQTQAYVIAQDIDYRCSYMCYIMLSLLGVPAVVSIGNTLTLEVWETLYTPFYVMNWRKFNRKTAPVKEATAQAVEMPEVASVMVENQKQGQLSLF